MARTKGSKNKVTKVKAERVAAKAKAKAKARSPVKADPPDWLRKAMAIPPKTKGRPPGTKNNRPKTEPQTLKRGKKPMATKPLYDPLDDPDLKAKDEALITPPPKQHKGTPLVAEREVEPEQQFDEVQSGAVIPDENMQALIAGTMGGSGDHHAMAKRIVERMKEAKWVTSKALDEGNIDALGSKRKPNASIKPDDKKDERKDDERKDDKR